MIGAALLGAAPSASAADVTAANGGVTATVTWDDHEPPGTDTSIVLHVSRHGVPVSDVPVAEDSDFLSIIAGTNEPPAVAVRDLDADGEQEVLVSLYTGGAHCCWVTKLYHGPDYNGPPAFFGFQQNPFRLRDLGRGAAADVQLQVATEDFVPVAHAATGRALVILNYKAGRFLDVTRRFKTRLRRDMKANRREWLAYERGNTSAQGALAAYVVDLKRLGRDQRAEQEIQRAGRRDQLSDGTIGFHEDIAKLMKALRSGRRSPFAHLFAP